MKCGLCAAAGEDYRLIMENKHAFAIIIREPQVQCHSLVLPKRHIEHLHELTAADRIGCTAEF